MAVKNSVYAIELTSIDSATFTGSYQAINSGGLTSPCFILRIVNNSTEDVTVSYNGTTDNEFVPKATQLNLTLQTSTQQNGLIANMSRGIIVHVKGATGTGLVYLSGYYQSQGV